LTRLRATALFTTRFFAALFTRRTFLLAVAIVAPPFEEVRRPRLCTLTLLQIA
jgi:hypothetical protein